MKNLVIITAPSGSGKTTLCKQILKKEDGVQFSISHTSRKMRQNEKNGIDYYFVTNEEFLDGINNDEFIEWNYHFDCYFFGQSNHYQTQHKNQNYIHLVNHNYLVLDSLY